MTCGCKSVRFPACSSGSEDTTWGNTADNESESTGASVWFVDFLKDGESEPPFMQGCPLRRSQ